MTRFALSAAVAATLAAAPAMSATVLLPGEVATTPMLSAPDARLDYQEFFGDGDVSGFGIAVDGVPGELSFGIGWSIGDLSIAFGGFAIDDIGTTVLQGDLTAVGFVGDTLEFRFESIAGSEAATFGDAILMELDMGTALPLGLASLEDGTSYDASATLSRIAPIPIPATLPLMAVALAGIAAARRR